MQQSLLDGLQLSRRLVGINIGRRLLCFAAGKVGPMSTTSQGSRSSLHRVGCASVAAVCALATAGCNNAAEGTLSGAALGAGAGAVIGSFFGSAGTGAAVGAVGGALGGGVIGDQNERRASQEYSRGPRTWSDYRHTDW